jgi:transcriptional regulator with XRE-family HTH domain
MSFKMKVGTKLCSVRQEKNLTQDEMGELLGISTSTYARLERNETAAIVTQVADFAEALSILYGIFYQKFFYT